MCSFGDDDMDFGDDDDGVSSKALKVLYLDHSILGKGWLREIARIDQILNFHHPQLYVRVVDCGRVDWAPIELFASIPYYSDRNPLMPAISQAPYIPALSPSAASVLHHVFSILRSLWHNDLRIS